MKIPSNREKNSYRLSVRIVRKSYNFRTTILEIMRIKEEKNKKNNLVHHLTEIKRN